MEVSVSRDSHVEGLITSLWVCGVSQLSSLCQSSRTVQHMFATWLLWRWAWLTWCLTDCLQRLWEMVPHSTTRSRWAPRHTPKVSFDHEGQIECWWWVYLQVFKDVAASTLILWKVRITMPTSHLKSAMGFDMSIRQCSTHINHSVVKAEVSECVLSKCASEWWALNSWQGQSSAAPSSWLQSTVI